MICGCRTDGTARFVKEAPDTITSWVITAFSLDTFHGLGVIEQPTKVRETDRKGVALVYGI